MKHRNTDMIGSDRFRQAIIGAYQHIPDTICTESARHALYAVATGKRRIACLLRTTEQEPFQSAGSNYEAPERLGDMISKHQKTLLIHPEGLCYVHSKWVNNYFFFYQKFRYPATYAQQQISFAHLIASYLLIPQIFTDLVERFGSCIRIYIDPPKKKSKG